MPNTFPEAERWITINGNAVKIDDDGTVLSGPPALKGKTLRKGTNAKPNEKAKPDAAKVLFKGAEHDPPYKPRSDSEWEQRTNDSLKYSDVFAHTETVSTLDGKKKRVKLASITAIEREQEKVLVDKQGRYYVTAWTPPTGFSTPRQLSAEEVVKLRGEVRSTLMSWHKQNHEKSVQFDRPAKELADKIVAKTGLSVTLEHPDDSNSRYLYLNLPKGGQFKIRFADHGQPVERDWKQGGKVVPVGGYDSAKGRRHTAADVSIDPESGVSPTDAMHAIVAKLRSGTPGKVHESALRWVFESASRLDAIRTEAETDFASALEHLDKRHREILRDALERYGRVQDIPEHIWRGIQFDIEERAAAVILAIIILGDDWTTSAIEDQGGRQRRLTLPQQASYAAAATIQASEMAAAATDSLRRRLARSVEDMRISGPGNIGNLTPSGIEKALDDVLNDQRRETLAIDQTTQGLSYGQMGARDRAGDGASTAGQATSIELYWVTERDDRVCERCSPLHDKPESVWGLVFPEGPGPAAHPNCRCSLRPVVVVQTAVKESDEGRWITIRGNAVKIDDDGNVLTGPLKGTTLGKKTSEDDLKAKRLSAGDIEPKNNVRNKEFFDALRTDMETHGWKGRPLLVLDKGDGSYIGLTGSHRTLAARDLGIEVPAMVIPAKFADDINLGGDDDMLLHDLKSLAKEHKELEAAEQLMRREVFDDTSFNADNYRAAT